MSYRSEKRAMKDSYGSGYFGEWIIDEFGLPAYLYTCNQLTDEKAVYPVHKGILSETEHVHQVGNDRLVGIVSNYGHVRVRQDEGSPKFLNDYDPPRYHFGGGIGYLIDGQGVVLNTFYSGQDEFHRVFGIGYFRKTVTSKGLTADQIIFAPFGDDPLLISQVSIKNNREKSVEVRWIEYWDCSMYQFSYKSLMRSVSLRIPASELRRRFSERFNQNFIAVDNTGILNTKQFKGLKLKDKIGWGILQLYLTFKGKNLTGGRVKSSVKEAVLEDRHPPPTFLVSLDAPYDGLSTSNIEFFGNGGVESPVSLEGLNPLEFFPNERDSGMFLERKITLEPGEQKTIFFAFGYLPGGNEIESLLSRYRDEKYLVNLLQQSCQQWNENRIRLTIPGESWVERELHWSYYYLRSNLTYDSFFQEHILSQGQVYQYIVGFQGAARDPLQHALPLTYCAPHYVKEILRYTFKSVQPDGSIPYGIVGSGHLMPAPFLPSDQEMWLLWLASEYVLATRDLEFLEEELPTYPIYGAKARKVRVKDLLHRCYYHVVATGTGKHGLQRISNGDWNDLVVHGFAPNEKHPEIIESGESVLNAAFAIFVLEIYSQLLWYLGEKDHAEECLKYAEAQCTAVSAQWVEKWVRRAWLTEDLGWIGEKEMWLEPQPWVLIGNAVTPEQREILIKAIDEGCRQPSPIGAMILNKGVQKKKGEILGTEIPDGIATNAGIWPSINGTLIWALSLTNGEMAWDEWKKNTFALHAEAYPECWYGIWSGPDTYNSVLSKYPGQTVLGTTTEDSSEEDSSDRESAIDLIELSTIDFPICCMHPHAWPLYNVTHLIGIKFTLEGVEFTPNLPKDEYDFSTPLLGFKKSNDSYSGWYAPTVEGVWKITLALSESEAQLFKTLEINEKEEEFELQGNKIIWKGRSTINKPLQWLIRK